MLTAQDLEHCFSGVGQRWERLRGKKLFVTGGTGIIGKWLLDVLLDADRRLDLGVAVTVLSRDPKRFAAAMPHLSRASPVKLIAGDVRDFDYPEGGFDCLIHAATDVIAETSPLDVFETCVSGTRHALGFAEGAGIQDILLLSSGAVYGPQPAGLEKMPEDYSGGPDPLSLASAYAEGKRASEWLVAAYAAERGARAKVARCFAMVGPHLPLDKHFAIGNFIRDALAGRPIRILGDGTTTRSYIYMADLARWLWTILFDGRNGAAYNVGSEEAITLSELASRVQQIIGSGAGVEILGQAVAGKAGGCYVPDTRRVHEELGLRIAFDLNEAIARTAGWYRPKVSA